MPGGPYRITEAAPEPSTSRRSGEPGRSRWSWPTTSSMVPGRIRTASGADDGTAVRFADESPDPDPAELYSHVYSERG